MRTFTHVLMLAAPMSIDRTGATSSPDCCLPRMRASSRKSFWLHRAMGDAVPTAKKESSTESLKLSIVVVDPPPNILWALQLGRDGLVQPTSATKARISFDVAVEVVTSDAAFRLRGPAVQGRPGDRFVYLRIGTYAGQTGTDVARRAKIGLEGITLKLLDAVRATPAGVLQVQFAGTDSKGGAACATVPLLGEGWYVA